MAFLTAGERTALENTRDVMLTKAQQVDGVMERIQNIPDEIPESLTRLRRSFETAYLNAERVLVRDTYDVI